MLSVATFLLGCLVTAQILRPRRDAETRAALEAATKAALTAAAAADAARAALGPAPARAVRLVKQAPVDRAGALASVHSALLQLEARRAAEPADAVPADGLARLAPAGPQDARHLVVEPSHGEPFHYAGTRTEDTETVEEIPIELPQPGAPAVAEVIVAAGGHLKINPMIRTRDRVRTLDEIVEVWDKPSPQRIRVLLDREATHLKVTGNYGKRAWSVRLSAPAELAELEGEGEGTGTDLFLLNVPAPREVAVHIETSRSWSARFVCGCLAGSDCACGAKEDSRLRGTAELLVHGTGEGLDVLCVPRPGLVVVTAAADARWLLRLRPVGGDGPEDARR
ncbi:hypothetical protein P3T36_003803 [Kitasatospora sp. MAP12-15]|uniref:hypothetical protein n=1 Tax=unclassified Kitasatospora TaxID=2633591 RepID=UPI002476360D|nr:hypothetical protein [Kitasatospora sp. MAP12-44]MDH6112392.1 hypothetical protein [Kitasatospora sp. MAP12-44]